jgi:predicted porin
MLLLAASHTRAARRLPIHRDHLNVVDTSIRYQQRQCPGATATMRGQRRDRQQPYLVSRVPKTWGGGLKAMFQLENGFNR